MRARSRRHVGEHVTVRGSRPSRGAPHTGQRRRLTTQPSRLVPDEHQPVVAVAGDALRADHLPILPIERGRERLDVA